jgi:SAM-dependent methyltransferase
MWLKVIESTPMHVTSGKPLVRHPYSVLAHHYDEALGLRNFRRTRAAFERVVRDTGFSFTSAADVGCGTGLFTCYLSRRWRVPVFGVDRAPEMLRMAARTCRDAPVCLLQQDIRCLRLPCTVDLVTANFDTVNHLLRRADLQTAFRSIARNLNPRGYFFFDVITTCRPMAHSRAVVLRHALRAGEVEQRLRWDPARRRISVMIVHHLSPCLPRVIEFHCERAYAPEEVTQTLFETGFLIRAVYDAETLQPAAFCPPRLIVLAQLAESH